MRAPDLLWAYALAFEELAELDDRERPSILDHMRRLAEAPTLDAAVAVVEWWVDEDEVPELRIRVALARRLLADGEEPPAELPPFGRRLWALARHGAGALGDVGCGHLQPPERDAQRLRDLVRHQRGALLDADLITEAEYAALAADPGAVGRLEEYDRMRARVAELEAHHASTHKAVSAALEARAKEIEALAERKGETPDWYYALDLAADIVRGKS